MIFDYCVVGGGIVGLATAMELLKKRPGCSLIVLEKESGLAQHQSGHNSGVIHSGIYYQPGSLKAELCRRGVLATESFCDEHQIPYDVCGKMLVATSALEAERMNALFARAKENRIAAERLDAEELKRREPNIAGVGALFIPSTGIVDYRRVAQAMGDAICSSGGEIEFNVKVDAIEEHPGEVAITAGERRWTAKQLIACAGLAIRSRGPDGQAQNRISNHSVSRRVLPPSSSSERNCAAPDLPDSQSGAALSRHSPHPNDRWRDDSGAERGARLRPRGLPQVFVRLEGRCGILRLSWILENHPQQFEIGFD